jgi:predicted GIY-YIG superfamily endonuclease
VPFWVYILRCVDGSYYAGQTDDLDRRLAMHRQGKIPGYTSERLPVELAWCEDAGSRENAIARERQIKGWSRRKKQALIDEDWERVSRLSRTHGPLPSLNNRDATGG